jgi:hypothetical protein
MKLLGDNETLARQIASDPPDEPMAGGDPRDEAIDLLRLRLQAMMDAYERRVRTACRSEADLMREPWRCSEYVAAEEAIRVTLGLPDNESASLSEGKL